MYLQVREPVLVTISRILTFADPAPAMIYIRRAAKEGKKQTSTLPPLGRQRCDKITLEPPVS